MNRKTVIVTGGAEPPGSQSVTVLNVIAIPRKPWGSGRATDLPDTDTLD